VARLLPDVAAAYRRAIDALPGTTLPAAEQMRARALLQEFLGGEVVVEAERERVLLRVNQDIRPLLRAAGGHVSNSVAGASFRIGSRCIDATIFASKRRS
jgi:hypothetical protein